MVNPDARLTPDTLTNLERDRVAFEAYTERHGWDEIHRVLRQEEVADGAR